MSDEDEQFAEGFVPPKVGDIEESNGFKIRVTEVSLSKGGFLWQVKGSYDEFAEARGYRTQAESLGMIVEPYPPPFIHRGTPRPVEKLSAADWDFRGLLGASLPERKLAFVHELARESARMREACRLWRDTQDPEKERARKKEWLAQGDLSRDDFKERCMRQDSERFLNARIKRLPVDAADLQADWIYTDTPWHNISQNAKDKFFEAEAKNREERMRDEFRRGLRHSDVECEGENWLWGKPLHIADEWSNDPEEHRGPNHRPKFPHNSGRPGLPEIRTRGNGGDAERLVTECLDICVCLNYRDEDILEGLAKWLKKRRAGLPDDLKDFRDSGKQAHAKLGPQEVDAGLVGLAALRLRAAKGAKEAAHVIRDLYAPENLPNIGNTQRSAERVIQWQEQFFPYCRLDSEPHNPPKLDLWERECQLCWRINRLPTESGWNYETIRCPWCDYREEMTWTPKGWVVHEH